MTINLIKIFTDELVRLTMVDGSHNICIIQSSKNDIGALENLSSDLMGLHEIEVTVNCDGNIRLDFPIKIKDIHTLEKMA